MLIVKQMEITKRYLLYQISPHYNLIFDINSFVLLKNNQRIFYKY